MIEGSCAFFYIKGIIVIINEFNEILERNIEAYLNNIAIELEEAHDRLFEDFGFPIFGETAKESHEQVYFQSYLESYTRKMINCILKDFIDELAYDDYSWPEFEYKGIYNGYTNSECEKEFGFEFINLVTKVGYRYSYFQFDEIDELLAKGNVEKIVLVEWENKDEMIGYTYGDERVQVILLWDLFKDLFGDLDEKIINDMYDMFTERVAAAVERADTMISLTTVPGFTPSYLYKNRHKTISDMRKEVSQLSCFSVNDINFKQNEENSKQLINTYNLSQYFLQNKYENAFVGTSDYAKSFLTSEYLYRYFKGNPMFDYTPIVSGYLKSIEQLLFAILSSYYRSNGIHKDFSGYVLSKYIIDLQRERVFRRELVPAKRFIIGCLNSYRTESRNNLFHKDYFNSWAKVEQIRKNTIFLYVVLLGSIDSPIIKNDSTVLDVLNIEYDKLFSLLDKQNDHIFSFELNNKEYSEMRKERRYEGLKFNENGLIMNTITFKKYDYDHCETVEISRANMPSAIWKTDSSGKKDYLLAPNNSSMSTSF